MHVVIAVIGGFTQDGSRRNGATDLYGKLRKFQSPACDVRYYPWDSRWDRIADTIYTLHGTDCAVIECGYSYGGGWGVPQFTKRLGKHGIPVPFVCLSDPVHRYPCPLLNWRNIIPRSWPIARPPIRLVGLVGKVVSFVQRTDEPSGDLVLLRGKPVKAKEVYCPGGHVAMDNHEVWHAECLAGVANFLSGG